MECPVYTLRVSAESTPTVPRCWWGLEGSCAPDQAGFSPSPINAVSGPAQLDWSSSCVPLTRGLKILWRVLCIPYGCPQTPRPRYPCTGMDRKGLVPLIRPGFLLPLLMQSQVPHDWFGVAAVFHSPEVLKSHGVSCV